MHVQVNTDNRVEGSDEFVRGVQAAVAGALGRFADQLTRGEVHVGDENGPKGGTNDLRCAMEARPAGLQPVAVTHTAPTADQAIDGAARKLHTALGRVLDKLADHKGRTPMGGAPHA